MADSKCRFSIDRGGTFTDIYAEVPGGCRVMKLLSEDPANYPDAPLEGIRRILEEVTGKSIPPGNLPTENIDWIRMGTTVATNALLERKGERSALIITKGFPDLLLIGNQARPKIFDLEIRKLDVTYDQSLVVEVDERVRLVAKHETAAALTAAGHTVVKGVTGEEVVVLRTPDVAAVRAQLQTVRDAGVQSIAIVFVHAYTYSVHEEMVAAIAREIGFENVSTSSTLAMVRVVPRGLTAAVDAYLTPCIQRYVNNFCRGFEGNLDPKAGKAPVHVAFMQSDGGLAPVHQFSGFRAILSGPAGGVVGYAMTTYSEATKQPVIGFDMGGTSTDVSRYAGRYEHVMETEIAGVTIQAPQLDVSTVAAGGGSRLFFRSGLFVVGPESAGSHPGPVCYRKAGGQLAITDANLFLGRLLPAHFPAIFGPNKDQRLDAQGAAAALEALAVEVNQYYEQQATAGQEPKRVTADEVAYGFIKVANETMCRPIRAITDAKGYDARHHVLACFGGAGGQHACALARQLGMRRVFVHRYSGILSAYGLGLADMVHEEQQPCAMEYAPANMPEIERRVAELSALALSQLGKDGFRAQTTRAEVFLNLRYQGTDTGIMTPRPDNGDYAASFVEQYQREFGFTLPNRALIVDDVRVRAVGVSPPLKRADLHAATGSPQSIDSCDCYFEGGRVKTQVYNLSSLGAGVVLQGPAIILDATATVLVEPNCTATITKQGDIDIAIGSQKEEDLGVELDAIRLSIFANRFMGIAEQMGKTLQRTSISTNIKERLDFSCALFSPQGQLVANAPHLPVHLGSMQEAVSWQIQHLGDSWREGEVLVSNHPRAGGSHLPDITVISPVWHAGKPIFYVASRGHHADIGGITPGSMPPFSHTLEEEGACIKSFKLVVGGVFQEDGITELLMAPAHIKSEHPSSGTRNLKDNLSDLRAQVAANNKGIALIGDLVAQYTLEVVQAYMLHVQRNAEQAVRDMLVGLSVSRGLPEVARLHAIDYMDDGTPIELALTINRADGSAEFDFTGTGPEVYGNCNAPKAVAFSAILYSLRCLIGREMPLNHGCMAPIKVVIPENTIITPSEHAAVVGGNVLTSQRVTDVILAAFGACAASQGCMNNFTFGDDTMGYYETIAGGAGAGPTWVGKSGVHTHMTNTRITDVEILERRYPVLVRRFSLRPGSGGRGKFNGGDGVIRELEFLKDLTIGVLCERRALEPPGMNGGGNGQRGVNTLVRRDGRRVNIGAKNTVKVQTGDRLQIHSPGGGAYGKAE